MITVIMINYKGTQDTVEAINSLKSQNFKDKFKIIVVDNCSPDNSFSILRDIYTEDSMVDIILSERNGGFAYGNNYGIEYALKNYNPDFFLLINNDTISDFNLLKVFKEFYINNFDKNIGILTGQICYFNSPNIIWFAGGKLQRKRAGGIHIGENTLNCEAYNIQREIDFATGCLMFFHKSLIDSIGLLPEEYFMYFEDVDFSWKVINSGRKIIYLPTAKILHKVGKSSDILTSRKNYEQFNRNRSILAKKYLCSLSYINFKIFMYTRNTFKFFKHLICDKEFVNTYKGL